MERWGWAFVVTWALSCSRQEEPPPAPQKAAPAATASQLRPPEPRAPTPSRAPRISEEELPEVMARLAFKPDPYAPPASCTSESRSAVAEQLVLTVRLRVGRDAAGSPTASQLAYMVSDSRLRSVPESPVSVGIPRLEFVRADGSVLARDFTGDYFEPGDATLRRTSDEVPRDPTWVEAWFAALPMDASVVAHRITLDGKVLAEQKRPQAAPTLSAIACDEAHAAGVKLSWKADGAKDAPLLIDVLRNGPMGFVEELPLTEARTIDGMTIARSPQGAERDAVLLVSVTDTFRLVSRGVLVPRRAL